MPEFSAIYLGYLMALLTALLWAVSVLLFRRSNLQLLPQILCLLRNSIASALLIITTAFVPGGIDAIIQMSWYEIGILALSGVVGITLADTFFFMAIKRIEMSAYGLIQCLYSPTVVVLAVTLLGERLTALQVLGIILVVSGSGIIAFGGRGAASSLHMLGLAAALGSVFCNALAAVLAKPILEHTLLIPAVTVRVVIGTVLLFVGILSTSGRSGLLNFSVIRGAIYNLLPATFLGSYVTMLCWMAGFKFAPASIASILNETSSFFIVILGVIFYKESLSRYKILAISLALIGLALVLGI